ncbi:TPA: DNA primase [Klebsiella variicola]
MSDLKELLEEFDFEQWLDTEGISYRRGSRTAKGREVNIRECPYCNSRSWKVYFNLTNGLGKCFAGDHPEEIQFNKQSFIKYHTGLSWRGLVKYVRDELILQGWRPKEDELELKSEISLSSEVILPPHYQLPIDGQLPTYLSGRNITAELAAYFDLRYCVEGTHVYLDERNGRPHVQTFDMRILIPIYDLDGKMRTFQGRDVTGTSDKRYLFPTSLPASGKFLYNGHNAVGKRTVIVSEGAFDVIGIKRALFGEESLRGFVEPIGTFGMHLSGSLDAGTDDQLGAFLKLKQKGLETVVMMWDSEKQAIHNTMGAAKRLVGIGLKVKIACLGEEGLDPGGASVEQILKAYYRARPYTKTLEMMAKLKGIRALI